MNAKLLLACMMLLMVGTLNAQNDNSGSDFKVKVFKNGRSDFGLSYNFFTGNDNGDFTTTIRGFGSGFLFDAFTGRYSKDILYVGTETVHLTLGAGIAINKYRFSEPLIFSLEGGTFSYKIDDDPTHEYGNGFFNNDKSKFVIGNAIFPAYLNFDVGEFYMSYGGTLDVFLSGKHKLKYTVDGKREKEVVRNNTFNDWPINKTKFGLSAMILHKPTGVNIGLTYMLTPFFKDESGIPDLNEVRISASYNLSWLDN